MLQQYSFSGSREWIIQLQVILIISPSTLHGDPRVITQCIFPILCRFNLIWTLLLARSMKIYFVTRRVFVLLFIIVNTWPLVVRDDKVGLIKTVSDALALTVHGNRWSLTHNSCSSWLYVFGVPSFAREYRLGRQGRFEFGLRHFAIFGKSARVL
jgi:hypothetical protein